MSHSTTDPEVRVNQPRSAPHGVVNVEGVIKDLRLLDHQLCVYGLVANSNSDSYAPFVLTIRSQ